MDRVIDEVAKGNFERGLEFDFYASQKKCRSKSREEVPVTGGGVGGPRSAPVVLTASGLLSPGGNMGSYQMGDRAYGLVPLVVQTHEGPRFGGVQQLSPAPSLGGGKRGRVAARQCRRSFVSHPDLSLQVIQSPQFLML